MVISITPLSRSDKPPFAGLSSCYEEELYVIFRPNSTEARCQMADFRCRISDRSPFPYSLFPCLLTSGIRFQEEGLRKKYGA